MNESKAFVCKKVFVSADGKESRTQGADTDHLRFRFGNGKELAVRVGDFAHEVQVAASWHGITQKIGDAFAGCDGDADRAWEMAGAMYQQLLTDGWYKKGERGGADDGSILVEALARFMNKTLDEAGEVIKAMSKENRKALRSHVQLAPVVAAIEAERAKAKQERLEAKAATVTDAMDLGALFAPVPATAEEA